MLGLLGTGSKSLILHDVFVPEHRSVMVSDLFAGTPPGASVHPDYPVLRAPRGFLVSYSLPPVAIALGRHGLDIACASLATRASSGVTRVANPNPTGRYDRDPKTINRSRCAPILAKISAVFWNILTLASFALTVVGIGISLLELSPAEFWGARICLIIAAIFLLGVTFRWMMTSRFSKGVRTGVGIGALATISLALLLGLNWIGNRAAAQTPAPNPPTINNSPGNCNNYGLNSGTITNNCPTINEAPAPSIKLLTPAFSQEPRNDGTFANQILIRVTALTNLGVQVCGDGIKDLFASPYPAGMSSVTNINAPPGCLRRRFDNAQGTWAIVVTTTAKDDKFVVTPMLLP